MTEETIETGDVTFTIADVNIPVKNATVILDMMSRNSRPLERNLPPTST